MKKIPLRMCVACRQMQPKKTLLRVVRTTEGKLILDRTGKCNGRGAYLCPKEECLNKAIKTRALDRALEQKPDDELIAVLRSAIDAETIV